MRIYEVVMEEYHDEDNITKTTQFVSGKSFGAVSKHFVKEAREIGAGLISIWYVLTVVQHLGEDNA